MGKSKQIFLVLTSTCKWYDFFFYVLYILFIPFRIATNLYPPISILAQRRLLFYVQHVYFSAICKSDFRTLRKWIEICENARSLAHRFGAEYRRDDRTDQDKIIFISITAGTRRCCCCIEFRARNKHTCWIQIDSVFLLGFGSRNTFYCYRSRVIAKSSQQNFDRFLTSAVEEIRRRHSQGKTFISADLIIDYRRANFSGYDKISLENFARFPSRRQSNRHQICNCFIEL